MSERATAKTRLSADYFRLFGASTISNLGDGIGTIAYPWLASAITRNPLLIALVVVVQRLPWLVFTLPAGVITDRLDRRRIMVSMNLLRAALTIAVGFIVLARTGGLPDPDLVADPDFMIDTDVALYLVVVVSALLLGMAEVLYDNSAQTYLPSIVEPELLERANGRLWAVEQVANSFVGPPLGAVLLTVGFAVPFFADGATFAVSAVLIALITVRSNPAPPSAADRASFTEDLREGFGWLWRHELLRPLAITLGLLNGLGAATMAIMILFAQEVLQTSATEFSLFGIASAVGGIVGGWTSERVAKALGPGRSLWLTMLGGGALTFAIGLMSVWWIAAALMGLMMVVAVLWNVITVSLRQRVIPDRLLGRVNSVYRFFGWGMMPIGSLLGGLLVVALDGPLSREWALRMPWIVAGALHLALFAYAAPRLTTAAIRQAESDAAARS